MELHDREERREALAVAMGAMKAYVDNDFDLVDRYPETYSGAFLTFGMAGLAGSLMAQLDSDIADEVQGILRNFKVERKVRRELDAVIPLAVAARNSMVVPTLGAAPKLSKYRWEALCLVGLASIKALAMAYGETDENTVLRLQHDWAAHWRKP